MKLEIPQPDELQARIEDLKISIEAWSSQFPDIQRDLRNTLSFFEDVARFRKLDRAFSLIVLKKVDGSRGVTISVQWDEFSTEFEATTGKTLLDAVDKLKGPEV